MRVQVNGPANASTMHKGPFGSSLYARDVERERERVYAYCKLQKKAFDEDPMIDHEQAATIPIHLL